MRPRAYVNDEDLTVKTVASKVLYMSVESSAVYVGDNVDAEVGNLMFNQMYFVFQG